MDDIFFTTTFDFTATSLVLDDTPILLEDFGLLPELGPVIVEAGGTSVELSRIASPCDPRTVLARSFGLGDGARFVIRDTTTGCVTPICSTMPAGHYLLELLDTDRVQELQPVSAGGGGGGGLAWLMEPPHSAAHWLTVRATKVPPKTAHRHCFTPPPAVSITGGMGDLTTVEWELLSPEMEAVEGVLRVGRVELSPDGLSARWPEMGITAISGGYRPTGPANSDRMGVARRGGRGASGWFHLRCRLPGGPELWLTTSDGSSPAKLVVKNRRLSQTGNWDASRLGPYADHSRCTAHGSHLAADGSMLCAGCEKALPCCEAMPVCPAASKRLKTELAAVSLAALNRCSSEAAAAV